MDFQKTERPLADSTVYIVKEFIRGEQGEGYIRAIFANRDAAVLAQQIYESRNMRWTIFSYEIEEWEVLDQTSISKTEGSETTAVDSGLDPDNVPATGT